MARFDENGRAIYEEIKKINKNIEGMVKKEGQGTNKYEIIVEGETGEIGIEDFKKLIDDKENTVIVNNNERYYLTEDAINYRTYMNINTPIDTQVIYKAIYVNTAEESLNYRTWNKEEVNPKHSGLIVDIGNNQYTYEGYVLPAIDVDDLIIIYENDINGIYQILKWNIYGYSNQLKVVSSDLILGEYSIDILVHNKYHCEYKWNAETTGIVNPNVETKEVVEEINVSSTHNQIPTAKAVYDYVNSVLH